MLSRVAENLYWTGRYLERAETTARLISATTDLLLDLPRQTAFDWQPLVEIIGAEDDFSARYPQASESAVMRFLIVEREHPASIVSALSQARENLRAARDLVPREVWEEVNALYLYVGDSVTEIERRVSRQKVVSRLVTGGRLVAGWLESGISRDAAYDFLRLGTLLERADMTTRVLDVRTSDLLPETDQALVPFQTVQWMSVLKSLGAYQMYRRHVRTRVAALPVVRFLIQDAAFPRSVRYCLMRMHQRLDRLPDSREVGDRARALADQTAARDLRDIGGVALSEFLDLLQIELARLGSGIERRYFGH